jgi:putative hydrolase of HD superfamily
VAQIAQLLGIMEENSGNIVDWAKLYKKALNHDVAEAFTGDILSHVKHRTPTMKKIVEEMEVLIAEDMLLSSFDDTYKDIFRDILFDGKDLSLEGRILKYADNIDALLECLYEKNLGNRTPFEEKYYEILGKLEGSDLLSVKIFLRDILPELDSKT